MLHKYARIHMDTGAHRGAHYLNGCTHVHTHPRVDSQGFSGAVTMGREVSADQRRRLLFGTSAAQSQLLVPEEHSDHRPSNLVCTVVFNRINKVQKKIQWRLHVSSH